ncbi:MAG: hypothetical protein ACK5WF_09445, partial [Cyclobacteriaceae bacterium]|jgi:hypothetical protein
MRIYHRYLGFFLAGIMAVYAISGIILIFRDTDFLKVEKKVEKELKPNLEAEELGKALRIRELQVTGTEGAIVSFAQGTYNKETGVAVYTTKELPLVLNKMTQLHKANTKQPLFFLNILFGLSLFFFVISSFWMFMPGTDVFKKGLYFAAAGLVIALLLIFIK